MFTKLLIQRKKGQSDFLNYFLFFSEWYYHLIQASYGNFRFFKFWKHDRIMRICVRKFVSQFSDVTEWSLLEYDVIFITRVFTDNNSSWLYQRFVDIINGIQFSSKFRASQIRIHIKVETVCLSCRPGAYRFGRYFTYSLNKISISDIKSITGLHLRSSRSDQMYN